MKGRCTSLFLWLFLRMKGKLRKRSDGPSLSDLILGSEGSMLGAYYGPARSFCVVSLLEEEGR